MAVSASLLGLAVKREREGQALLLGLAAAGMILTAAIRSLSEVESLLRQATERADLSASLTVPVLKSLGLALLGRFTAELCREAGQNAAASAVELAATCAILCVSVPLLQSLLEVVFSFS